MIFVLTENHQLEIRNGNLFVDNELITEEKTNEFIGKSVYGNGHKYLIAEFYKALREDKESPVTLESAQYAVRILLSAYESNDNEILV